jgi:hypothetical protein
MLGKMVGKFVGKIFVSGLLVTAVFILNSESKKTVKEAFEIGKQSINQIRNK